MENKYYTPKIEELHVGFEVELLELEHYVWGSYVIENRDKLGDFDDYIFNRQLRVKYLDQQDIESLGWKLLGSGWYDLIEVPGTLGYFLYVRLRFFGNNSFIQAYRYDPATTPNTTNETLMLFSGDIKNKSRLKLLMEMTKIDK